MTTINTLDDFLQALDDNPAWRDAVRARLLGKDLLELPAKFNDFAERQQRTNERLEGTLEELRRMNANAEARMNRMESDMSAVKGGHIRARLDNLSYDLTERMRLELAHVLERSEIVLVSRRIPDAAPEELNSFRQADMVILAADRAGGPPLYLAIEASWTGSRYDTDRAQRNARLLTVATGLPAVPVIASVRNTHEVDGLIESGAVRWYRIEERDVQAE